MAQKHGISRKEDLRGADGAGRISDVRMLGGFAIRLEGRLAHAGLGAAGRRLAAYLFSYPNRMHRKERLADLFWPDFNAKHGRHALNTVLWRLRQLLDRSELGASLKLVSAGSDIVMEARDTSLIDVHRFQELVTPYLASEAPARDAEKLRAAMAVYQGPFLDGEDEDWILVERERLHFLYVRCLDRLMRLVAQSGHYEDALEYGRLILTIDPLRESVQRSVMLLYVLNGQQAEAIRQFDRCRERLRHEIDVAPMPETERLDALIRSGEVFDRIEPLFDGILGEGMGSPTDPPAS